MALIWEKDQPGEHETVTYQYAWVVGLGGRGHGHTITLPCRVCPHVCLSMLEKCSVRLLG